MDYFEACMCQLGFFDIRTLHNMLQVKSERIDPNNILLEEFIN